MLHSAFVPNLNLPWNTNPKEIPLNREVLVQSSEDGQSFLVERLDDEDEEVEAYGPRGGFTMPFSEIARWLDIYAA